MYSISVHTDYKYVGLLSSNRGFSFKLIVLFYFLNSVALAIYYHIKNRYECFHSLNEYLPLDL